MNLTSIYSNVVAEARGQSSSTSHHHRHEATGYLIDRLNSFNLSNINLEPSLVRRNTKLWSSNLSFHYNQRNLPNTPFFCNSFFACFKKFCKFQNFSSKRKTKWTSLLTLKHIVQNVICTDMNIRSLRQCSNLIADLFEFYWTCVFLSNDEKNHWKNNFILKACYHS